MLSQLPMKIGDYAHVSRHSILLAPGRAQKTSRLQTIGVLWGLLWIVSYESACQGSLDLPRRDIISSPADGRRDVFSDAPYDAILAKDSTGNADRSFSDVALCDGITCSVDPCQSITCGVHAHCTDGLCSCDSGFEGDPFSGCAIPSVPKDFAGVIWLHTNVSSWAETATLSQVTVDSSTVCLNYDKANTWPGVDHVGAFVNANPWIFVLQNGTWYGATWEWMRFGQTCKNRSSVAGDHIKMPPLNTFSPQSGVWYGFMVSGLARDNTRNVEERSPVLMVQWP